MNRRSHPRRIPENSDVPRKGSSGASASATWNGYPIPGAHDRSDGRGLAIWRSFLWVA